MKLTELDRFEMGLTHDVIPGRARVDTFHKPSIPSNVMQLRLLNTRDEGYSGRNESGGGGLMPVRKIVFEVEDSDGKKSELEIQATYYGKRDIESTINRIIVREEAAQKLFAMGSEEAKLGAEALTKEAQALRNKLKTINRLKDRWSPIELPK